MQIHQGASHGKSSLRPIQSSLFILLCWTTLAHATASVNVPLDDPMYPLLEKIVSSNLTFSNALTIKPITRLHAAHVIAEAIRHRRREWEGSQRQDLFIDQTLQYLARRFKRELRQIGFFYQPQRHGALALAALNELKVEMLGASNQFVHRDSSGRTSALQGTFPLNEGFAHGDDFSMRLRSISWATLWRHVALYLEPEVIVRSDPLIGDRFDSDLFKAYMKISALNLDLEFGRDTLWWGPASQGDLALSNNAPPLELLKLSTPMPFRLPWKARELGEWQITYFIARLEANRAISHALVSGLRMTWQPTSFAQFGVTTMLQAFGDDGVSPSTGDFFAKHFDPPLNTKPQRVNGLVTYNVVLSLPFVRDLTLLKSATFYWQRGHDNAKDTDGIFGGGNILGGRIDGGRWDLRMEFAETRDDAVWYTHPTYQNGLTFKKFLLGHPIGGAADSLFGRATYYLQPTTWLAVEGRSERYGLGLDVPTTTSQRYALEASHQVSQTKRNLVLWGRLEYATIDNTTNARQETFLVHIAVRWRL